MSYNILAIDTSNMDLSVALCDKHGNNFDLEHKECIKHAQFILPTIDKCLLELKLTLEDLDAIALVIGPGSFTGIRVGFSTVQALAYAKGIPVVEVSSLSVIALNAKMKYSQDLIDVAIDARMQEVYYASFDFSKDFLLELSNPAIIVSDPKNINVIDKENTLLVGNGFTVYRDCFDFAEEKTIDPISSNAKYALLYANQALKQGHTKDVTDLKPLYVRNNVAKKKSS